MTTIPHYMMDVALKIRPGALAANAAIAAELMRVAGLDDAKIAAAFNRFEPLPHRMNLVAEVDGVRFIDDSKATSLAALVAGVKMAMPIARGAVRGLETEDVSRRASPAWRGRARKRARTPGARSKASRR